MPDRYSADEARRIFARAARRQHAAPTPDGLTVADLEQIGREVGLDPALVAAEAAAERLGDGHQATWHGVPVGVRRARLMPAGISDREWEQIVDLLRAEFKVEGTAQQIGTRREWATGPGSSSASMTAAYNVRVEARPDGDLVTIEAPRTSQLLGYSLGGTFALMALLIAAVVPLAGPEADVAGALTFGGVTAVVAVLSYLGAWVGAKVSAVRTPERFEALLDRIDLASRSEAPAVAAPSSSRIDPAHLGGEPEARPWAAHRPRIRS